MISKFFIEHPVLANVLAIVLVIIGAVSVLRLPIAQYPNITPPTVQVTTRYPGASPQTVVNTIALPIELQVNGVPGMIYMQSTSAYDGTYVLTVTFDIGSDPNMDQVLVQNRVQNAMAQLPEAVQAQGVAIRAKSSSILEFVTLHSPDKSRDALFMWNYATINLVNELARLPGVGNVTVMGAGEYSMRIWMDPQKLYSYGLVPSDVIRVIRQQSQEVAAGQVGMPPAPSDQAFQYTIDIKSRLDDPKQFADIIVKDQTAQGGRLVRLKDVARIDLGAQTYAQDFKLSGKPAAGIAIYQTPDANSLKVAAEVDAKMKELSRHFPPGLEYSIPYNTTIFVKNSINEVYKTLWQAGVLVLIVILVFLQNFRAILVPATTVPVTIIGAFAGDGSARLHGKSVDPVRPDPGHRHRRRRRDRHRRGRVEIHRAGNVRARCRDPGDERIVRADHRHHPGADGRVPAVGLCSGAERPDVRPVCPGHRGDGADQRDQRGHSEADAMRAVAAHAQTGRAAQHFSFAASNTFMRGWRTAMPG